MKKILFFLLISNYLFAQWSISNAERSSLISLYNSLDGDHWSTQWDFEKDPKSWYGIKIKNGVVSEINLKGNALKGNFPTVFSSFPNLTKLDLSSNLLTGTVSPTISGLSHLVRIDISHNNLEGDPSSVLASLTNLQELSLGNNHFLIADIESFLQSFNQIKVLNLAGLALTQSPQRLSSYTQLQVLDLSNNTISQNYNSLSGLASLRELNISGNQLTSIPATVSILTSLTTLNLANNLLSNNFSGLSSFSNLEWLSLENNQIGNLPSELNQLSQLIHLNLGRNQLSSVTALVNLPNLEQIFLNNNRLSGNFPGELLQLKKLQMLSLTGNNLEGSLPNQLPALTFLENNRFNQAEIKGFLDKENKMADFLYSPQRYDETKTVSAEIGEQVTLSQSLTGNDYLITWFKNLDQNTGVHSTNYTINSVQTSDFSDYTAEAYFLKAFPKYLMEMSFFREIITLNKALATEEIQKELSIYPNPTRDYIHIKTKNTKVESSMIFDASGKKVLESKESVINVKHLPSGNYLLIIKTEKGNHTMKWIKQ